MVENKSTSDILLEERIAQIDDINFDKIYDIEQFAANKIENFENEIELQNEDSFESFDNHQQFSAPEAQSLFELEVQPNEFLDNYNWDKQEEVKVEKKRKFNIANKPLFYTFTSIAMLLCILFLYNVFVINSLESTVAKRATALNAANANVSYVVEEENNYILFENQSKMEIEKNKTENNTESEVVPETNWFDVVCNYINNLFGGNY